MTTATRTTTWTATTRAMGARPAAPGARRRPILRFPPTTLAAETKREIVARYGRDEHDAGSTEVRVAALTVRINDLTGHPDENRQPRGAQG